MTQVATILVKRQSDGYQLWGRRRDTNLYTTPGGKFEGNESPEQAAARELFEEAGIVANPDQLVKLGTREFPERNLTVHCFVVIVPDSVKPSSANDPDHEVSVWEWLPTMPIDTHAKPNALEPYAKPKFTLRKLQTRAKDASGHEHKANGQFGSGGSVPTKKTGTKDGQKNAKAKLESAQGGIGVEHGQKLLLDKLDKRSAEKVNKNLHVLLGKDKGIHTLLTAFSASGASPRIESISTSDKHVDITLTLHNEKGEKIGRTQRVIEKQQNGELHAQQTELVLDTEYLDQKKKDSTGKGLGTRIVNNNFREYEKMGVTRVSLEAAFTGIYVWAKMGFVADPADLKRLNSSFQTFLSKRGIKSPDFSSVNEIANFTKGSDKVGKDFLLNSAKNWQGSIHINNDDPNYKITKAYLSRVI